MGIFANTSFVAGFLAWSLAQFLKVPMYAVITKKWDWSRIKSSGGMPSSHSSTCTAIATAIGMTSGFDNPLFTVAAGLAAIVMYDAAGVRWETGKQAKYINEIVETMQKPDSLTDEKLKEWIGHTPFEVAAGGVLGIIVAVAVVLTMRSHGAIK